MSYFINSSGAENIQGSKLKLSFSGVLACLDGYMNIALEQTEEYANGQVS